MSYTHCTLVGSTFGQDHSKRVYSSAQGQLNFGAAAGEKSGETPHGLNSISHNIDFLDINIYG